MEKRGVVAASGRDGLLRATGGAECLVEAAEGQFASGPDSHRGGEEAGRLIGLTASDKRPGKVEVDPEIIWISPLGKPQQGRRRLLLLLSESRQSECQPRQTLAQARSPIAEPERLMFRSRLEAAMADAIEEKLLEAPATACEATAGEVCSDRRRA